MRGATIGKEPLRVFIVFQPTRPLRGATTATNPSQIYRYHFNPRAPCGARLHEVVDDPSPFSISTHAPLAGRDPRLLQVGAVLQYFNPRAPCGARPTYREPLPVCFDFNPRAPCGARPASVPRVAARWSDFNPRAPCGARPMTRHFFSGSITFQPTRPLRGATKTYLRTNP